ncbi:hypothetical protein EXIGLDRAFT_770953 [Exidia glandulosa HHB12029]|uniref:DUF6533 domain-containing protein n=1 Tax=Exidia glandulosa HHB12029 TaxID=1314781 RepID=A0A165GC65_EXIGL|nr:hypothetical protein EXIGLDRAFT_770953 [Exidia glandulosa HHB12029]
MSVVAQTQYWDVHADQAAAFARGHLLGNYLATATIALVLYEHIVTIGAEYRYIHKAPWSLPKAAFLLNRYFIIVLSIFTAIQHFLPATSSTWCAHSLQLSAAGSVIVSSIVDFSLLLRIHAFWNRSSRILLSVSAIYVLCVTAAFVGLGLSFRQLQPLPSLPSGFPQWCISTPGKELWIVIVPTLCFDTVIVVLTVIRAAQLGEKEHTPLVMHLAKTGVGYYLVTLVCNVILAVMFAYSSSMTGRFAFMIPPATGILDHVHAYAAIYPLAVQAPVHVAGNS